MFKTFLKIRTLQIYRLVKSVGIFLMMIFIPLAGVSLLGLLQILANSNPNYLSAGIPIVVFFFHYYRNDGRFLQLTFSKKEIKQILLIEYFSLTVLILLFFVLTLKSWSFVPPALLGTGIIAFFPFIKKQSIKSFSIFPTDFLPPIAFEWKWAIRKFGWLLLIIWLSGFLGIKFTGAPILAVLVFSIMLCSAFEYLENKEMILATGYDSGFLIKKALLHLKIFHLLFMPQHILFFVVHSEFWYIHLAAVVASSLMISFAVFKKYSEYAPNRIRIYNGTQVGIFVLFATVPFLMPAAIAQIFFFYRKAKGNMDFYFSQKK